ncbi:TspO/MBR family protein [Cyanobium gracile]|uniref:Tryptophan-rich sensory protein n=1 Tax=Cyanobium gracile (strain ATCC 27147 / PCC 6307) TaxID=292564 RepID=K9P3N4_CYAGP|nr:TspO/MBR family protein [Cyanobium gracile]AFY27593.1 tryptophan-rich sensory protein [Cyanobium gracile PCC 6307]
MTATAPAPRFRWWHGAAILVAANAVSFWPAGVLGDAAFYTSFRLPPYAPPDWLLAPLWLVLNITSLVALARVANLDRPDGAAWRRGLVLVSEGVGWLLFAVFTTFFFWLHSPVLAAADTVAGLLVAGVSVAAASRLDRPAAGLIGLRLLWLLLASAVAASVALHNIDPFLSAAPAPGVEALQ